MSTLDKLKKARNMIQSASTMILAASENYPLNGESIDEGLMIREDKEAKLRNDMMEVSFGKCVPLVQELSDLITKIEQS